MKTQSETEKIRPIPHNFTLGYSCPSYSVYHHRHDDGRYFVCCFLNDDFLFTFYGQIRSLQAACDMCEEQLHKITPTQCTMEFCLTHVKCCAEAIKCFN